MKKVLIIVGAILGVALLSGASFWGGMTYQSNRVSQARAAFFNSRGGQPPANGQFPTDGQTQNGTQGQNFFRGGTVGQVKSINGNVLTLSTAQNVITVNLSDSTQFLKSVTAAFSDLQPGDRVMVSGQRDSKGDITASEITIITANTSTTGTAP